MLLYVPYFSIVDQVTDAYSPSREIISLETYRLVVEHNPTLFFYHQAGNYYHMAISPFGERLCLSTEEERRQFYSGLPKEEKMKIKEKGDEELVRLCQKQEK